MMITFSGKFLYTVDAKGRINIPAVFRNQLSAESENAFHITHGPNDCLFVYPREIFTAIAAKLEVKYGSLATPDEERRFLLETMANAHTVRCDQQGRIVVPREHLDYADIDGDVLIIGVFNKLEFWNPVMYETFMKEGRLSQKERVKRFGGADRE
jgi:MraZ protein